MAFAGDDVSPEKKTGFSFRGKEIILSKTRGRPFSGLVKKGMENGVYPEEKRIEAVTIYAASGSFEATHRLTAIPTHTLRKWRKEDWFQALLKEIRQENNERIDARFTAIAEHALEQLEDRLNNGDVQVLRDGTLVRRPISGKDLSLITAINIDKRELLRGEPTSRSEAVGQANLPVVKKLERLAETFENLAKIGRKPVTYEDAQVIEVKDASSTGTETEGTSEKAPA